MCGELGGGLRGLKQGTGAAALTRHRQHSDQMLCANPEPCPAALTLAPAPPPAHPNHLPALHRPPHVLCRRPTWLASRRI